MKYWQYELYMNDEKVIKGGGNIVLYFLIPNEELILNLYFSYRPFDSNKRVQYSFHTKNSILKSISRPLSKNTIIVMNAEDRDYAISYRLLFDAEKRNISITLLNEPNMGEMFITNEEKKGIILNY
jgi:hypothetical protein